MVLHTSNGVEEECKYKFYRQIQYITGPSTDEALINVQATR